MLRIAIPLVLAAAATLAYGLMGVQQLQQLASRSWDLGIFSQLAKDYAHLQAPIVPIKGDGVNLLGDHFHPILVLLGIVWRIWPSPLALLWTQALLFGVSACPLARLAIARLGVVPGTVLGGCYVFSFGLQSAADVQFHEIAFAVPLLAFALTALLRDRVTAAICWAAPLVFVKEDLGLTLLVLGLVIALRRPAQKLAGFALALWGTGWFVLTTFVILPLLSSSGSYEYTSNVGGLAGVFTPGEKWMTVGMLVLAVGVIGLRSPLVLTMLPTLAWRFTGTVEFYWGWYWHYNAVLMPIAAAALLDTLGGKDTGEATVWRATDRPRPGRRIRTVAIAALAAATLVLGSAMPVLSVVEPSAWSPDPRAAAARAAVQAVPDGTVVASDITLMAPLVPDHDVQWTHGTNTRVPQCVVVDQEAFSWGDDPPQDTAQWAADTYRVPYAQTFDDDGFQVACRPA
jgi:uncharacterized membrane protein